MSSYEVNGCPDNGKHDGWSEHASYCPDCEIEILRARIKELEETGRIDIDNSNELYHREFVVGLVEENNRLLEENRLLRNASADRALDGVPFRKKKG